jgi:hypothetical protein
MSSIVSQETVTKLAQWYDSAPGVLGYQFTDEYVITRGKSIFMSRNGKEDIKVHRWSKSVLRSGGHRVNGYQGTRLIAILAAEDLDILRRYEPLPPGAVEEAKILAERKADE